MTLTVLGLYALQYLNTPYQWGGNDFTKFDCSGYTLKVLRDVGIELSDRTAADIYEWTLDKNFQSCSPGADCLLFFGKSRITHVAISLSNDIMIEAGGGDRNTLTIEDAIKADARVRLKPINSRIDLLHSVKIKY